MLLINRHPLCLSRQNYFMQYRNLIKKMSIYPWTQLTAA